MSARRFDFEHRQEGGTLSGSFSEYGRDVVRTQKELQIETAQQVTQPVRHARAWRTAGVETLRTTWIWSLGIAHEDRDDGRVIIRSYLFRSRSRVFELRWLEVFYFHE